MLIEHSLLEALQSGRDDRVRTGATGLRAFASEAGGCARKVSYDLMADRPKWTPNLTQAVAFRLGKDLEDAVLAAAEIQNISTRRQVPWTLDGGEISGVADGTYIQQEETQRAMVTRALWDDERPAVPPTGSLVVMEVKSMAQTYFTQAQKKGPEMGHLLQASLGALALGGSWIHVVYVSKGAKQSESPVLEWIRPVDPEMTELARAELLIGVAAARAGVPADPWQMGDLITRPSPKRPPCLWCSWLERCSQDGVDVARATEERINGAGNRYSRSGPLLHGTG